ncbi:hypothetical protein [Spirillospora sp. CA-294931]|uniref:hypothetical protein n=1 Tax=Spirillospora sp. CA-294931 TaxID=3240042 RepID=UPI003D8C2B6A
MLRRRNDHGVTGLEYTALIGVGAAVIGLFAVLLPERVAPETKSAICELFAGECEGSEPRGDIPAEPDGPSPSPTPTAAPLQPCAVSTVERNRMRQTLLGIDTRIDGKTISVQDMSDGTTFVKEGTVKGNGYSIGLAFDLPKGVSGSLQLTANDLVEQGDILILKDDVERRGYLAYRKALGSQLWDADNPGELLERNSALGVIRRSLTESTYTKLTSEGTAKLGASLFGSGASAELGLGSSSIVQHNIRTGDKTMTFQLDAKALGQLGILLGPEAHGQVDGQVTMSVTVDKDGKPKTLQLGSQVGFQGQINNLNGDLGGAMDHAPTGKMGRLGNLLNSAATSVGVTHTTDPRGVLQANVSLDLTDPQNRQAFEGFLKNPSQTGGLVDRLGAKGTLDLQVYEGTAKKDAVEMSIQAVFGLGVKSEQTTTQMTLKDAWTLTAEGGLKHRTDCLR